MSDLTANHILKDWCTYASQLHGYVATAASNVHDRPLEFCPRVAVSQLVDVGGHFLNDLSVLPFVIDQNSRPWFM